MLGVERFTLRKLVGVIASLVGIILISRVDLSTTDAGDATSVQGGGSTFPHKTPTEIAVGDAMAAFSSVMYGVYTIVMKKQVGDESRVDMSMFFGMVGFFNLILLWPGFFVLHWTGVEPFALPSTQRVWVIILVRLEVFYLFFLIFYPPPHRLTPVIQTIHYRVLTLPIFFFSKISPLSGELAIFFNLRHCMGIRHATHHSARGHRRSELDHSAIPRWTNVPSISIRVPAILARGHDCLSLFLGRQP